MFWRLSMSSRDRVKRSLDALFPPEEQPNLGEGISRPRNPNRAREYRLVVTFDRAKPMRVLLMAETANKAVKYAQNRWPAAVVELIQ